jgi:hypothetical protein
VKVRTGEGQRRFEFGVGLLPAPFIFSEQSES